MDEEYGNLAMYLMLLSKALASESPNSIIVLAARYLMVEYNRDSIPDWVAALASSNLNNWIATIDEVRTLEREEVKDDQPSLFQ